jgi:hypothetical protein
MTITKQNKRRLSGPTNSWKIDMITIPEVCAKELGDNLHHERRCRPAFSKPCQTLSFRVSLGRKILNEGPRGRVQRLDVRGSQNAQRERPSP